MECQPHRNLNSYLAGGHWLRRVPRGIWATSRPLIIPRDSGNCLKTSGTTRFPRIISSGETAGSGDDFLLAAWCTKEYQPFAILGWARAFFYGSFDSAFEARGVEVSMLGRVVPRSPYGIPHDITIDSPKLRTWTASAELPGLGLFGSRFRGATRRCSFTGYRKS